MTATQGKRRSTTGPRTRIGSRRRPRTGASASSARKPGKESVSVPLLTVWIVALFLLVTLVLWTKGNPFHRSAKSSKETRTAAISLPSSQGPTPQEKKPAMRERPLQEEASQTARPNGRVQETTAAASVPKAPPGPVIPPTVPRKPPIGRVALVIDDFGYDLAMARKFIDLSLPVTFSVLPHLPHTREVAALAAAHGHEVLLHMPMEPQDYPKTNPGPGALLVGMTPQQMVAEIDKALRENPYARGVNNHMGSKFTEDLEAMRIVLQHLKSKDFYFLDSYTSGRSAALSVARELGIPCTQRDIFLDHEPTEGFVRRQIAELIRRAKLQGQAVAIGHPHPVTLRVLQEEADSFAKEGIEVVPLKKLLEESSGKNSAESGVS
ncbi:MAG: divergent polysaccharide deacetylase family protein [Desulfosoma sp.]|uniref:divergent polysaccharide deacetylase family protein n=1 Tax=Desulfosoma sp. TaxID=2603217 RepID=UPI00404ADE74